MTTTTGAPTTSDIRTKGQVWTPAWVSRAMARYVLTDRPACVHEPAVGSGSLIEGLASVARELDFMTTVHASELHPEHIGDLIERSRTVGIDVTLSIGDFLEERADGIEAILANPPYIRHHRFGDAEKTKLQRIAETTLGCQIDRRTGVQTFFLLRAIARMRPGARGAFILPADVVEGVSARTVFRRLAMQCGFEGVATFSAQATPFPGVDTNPIVLFFRKGVTTRSTAWRRFETSDAALEEWVASGFERQSLMRDIDEAVGTGFSREPRAAGGGETVRLGTIVQGMRGIATGANEYFLKTRKQIEKEGLPPAAFRRCVGRTRDVAGLALTANRLEEMEAAGRPTHLLYLNTDDEVLEDETLRAYLRQGEAAGYDRMPLISTRRPWWRMERREPAAILFAYLGRGRVRFIRNIAGALPLNGFLCIEPRNGNDPNRVLSLLNDPRTTAALAYEAKSYGGGALKVEPNAIERVAVPRSMIAEYGLTNCGEQMEMFA